MIYEERFTDAELDKVVEQGAHLLRDGMRVQL